MDEHFARRVLASNFRDVFDRIIVFPEPFEVISSSPIPPRAVFAFDDPEELRHASSIDALSENGDRVRGPKADPSTMTADVSARRNTEPRAPIGRLCSGFRALGSRRQARNSRAGTGREAGDPEVKDVSRPLAPPRTVPAAQGPLPPGITRRWRRPPPVR